MIGKRPLKTKARALLATGQSRQHVYDKLNYEHPERKETILEVLKYTASAALKEKYQPLMWLISIIVVAYFCFNAFALSKVNNLSSSELVKVILAMAVQLVAIISLQKETLKSFLLVFFIGFYGTFSYFKELEEWMEVEIIVRILLIVLSAFLHFKMIGKYERIKEDNPNPKGKRISEYIRFKN
jgi:hypothetical protein